LFPVFLTDSLPGLCTGISPCRAKVFSLILDFDHISNEIGRKQIRIKRQALYVSTLGLQEDIHNCFPAFEYHE
jgi:hypothetical protein